MVEKTFLKNWISVLAKKNKPIIFVQGLRPARGSEHLKKETKKTI